MKFCPQCDTKLGKRIDGWTCSKCDYAEDLDGRPRTGGDSASVATSTPAESAAAIAASQNGTLGTTTAAKAHTSDPDENNAFEVFDASDEDDETRPTIKIECERCGHDEAVWWMLQTRSADEPTTQFYRCTKCEHTWRDYS